MKNQLTPLILLIVLLPLRASGVGRGTDLTGGREHPEPPIVEPIPGEFEMVVISDRDGLKAESPEGQGSRILVQDGERYSIRLHNPLPVRVVVGLTVDGINTITGEPGSPATGAKWMIQPNATTTIDGFQVGESSARRFVFTSRDRSYGKYRADRDPRIHPDYGEIAAAFFWSTRELAGSRQPVVIEPLHEPSGPGGGGLEAKPAARSAEHVRDRLSIQRPPSPPEDAGTAMGERTAHPVRRVSFEHDAGMYDPSQFLRIHYALQSAPIVVPLHRGPRWERDPSGYAPEMPAYSDR